MSKGILLCVAKLNKIVDELVPLPKHQTPLSAVPPRQAFQAGFLKGTRNHNGSKQNFSNAKKEELFQATIHSDPNHLQNLSIILTFSSVIQIYFLAIQMTLKLVRLTLCHLKQELDFCGAQVNTHPWLLPKNFTSCDFASDFLHL